MLGKKEKMSNKINHEDLAETTAQIGSRPNQHGPVGRASGRGD